MRERGRQAAHVRPPDPLPLCCQADQKPRHSRAGANPPRVTQKALALVPGHVFGLNNPQPPPRCRRSSRSGSRGKL